MKLYREIANALQARNNCLKNNMIDGVRNWDDCIKKYNNKLPSGAGFDSGTTIVFNCVNPDHKIELSTMFHHMNDTGYYDGWTDHIVTIRPSLLFGFTLNISGENKNEIKEYMYEVFNNILNEEI